MMESVKKTIVMLQLAKRSVSKNVKETAIEAVHTEAVQAEVAQLSISSTSSSVHSGESPLNGNIDGGMGEEFKTPQKQEDVPATGVPLMSYSSTDDENDDFEDAYDEVQPSEPSEASKSDGGDKKDASSDISLAKVSSKDFFMNEDEGIPLLCFCVF